MGAENVMDVIEGISGKLVLLDSGDLPGLAELHGMFESLASGLDAAGKPRGAEAARLCAQRVESIILQEAESPDHCLETVGAAVGVLQHVARGDASDEDAVFFSDVNDPEDTDEGANAPGRAYQITLPPYVDASIFAEFLSRQAGSLDEMESLLLALEHGSNPEAMTSLRRYIHTLKGESALLGLSDIESLCHVAEDLIGEETMHRCVDALLGMKDWIGRAFDAYAGAGPAPEPPKSLLAQLKALSGPVEKEAPVEISGGVVFFDDAPADNAPQAAPDGEAAQDEAQEVTLEATGEDDVEGAPLSGDQELIGEFIVEATEHLETADLQLLTLETDPNDENAINAIFRAFHTIKGVSGFLDLHEIGKLAHEAENLLDQARKKVFSLEGRRIDLAFEAVDKLKQSISLVQQALESGGLLFPTPGAISLAEQLREASKVDFDASVGAATYDDAAGERLGDILVEKGVATEGDIDEALKIQEAPPSPKKIGDVLRAAAAVSSKDVDEALALQQAEGRGLRTGEILVEMGAISEADLEEALTTQSAAPQKQRLGEVLVREKRAPAKDVAQALRAQQPERKQETVQVREAVKVDATRLDYLIDTIGELVIAETMVAQSQELRSVMTPALARHLSQLEKITRELQEMATSLRMVPVRATFQKMARLVRDLAKKTGKSVDFSMSGEDTELDKSVVDQISDPLVHMVRNAVDHGLEDSEEDRRALGKTPEGHVHLSAYHEGGNIHVCIQDDGRGLNVDRILAKATERGLVREGETLSEREIFNLIFEPGFSTAQTVTAVSGRGVGMDVVRRNIEALRGQIQISSVPGQGSVFTIQLPLTLAIIDGMVVKVGAERYVIPTLSIVLSLRPGPKDITTVSDRGEMLRLHGELIPLFRLQRLFGVQGAMTDYLEGTVVVVEKNGKKSGILIDEILGQQQIVIKSLGEALRGTPGVAGGAIMPDGKVGLILDIGGVVKLALSAA